MKYGPDSRNYRYSNLMRILCVLDVFSDKNCLKMCASSTCHINCTSRTDLNFSVIDWWWLMQVFNATHHRIAVYTSKGREKHRYTRSVWLYTVYTNTVSAYLDVQMSNHHGIAIISSWLSLIIISLLKLQFWATTFPNNPKLANVCWICMYKFARSVSGWFMSIPQPENNCCCSLDRDAPSRPRAKIRPFGMIPPY